MVGCFFVGPPPLPRNCLTTTTTEGFLSLCRQSFVGNPHGPSLKERGRFSFFLVLRVIYGMHFGCPAVGVIVFGGADSMYKRNLNIKRNGTAKENIVTFIHSQGHGAGYSVEQMCLITAARLPFRTRKRYLSILRQFLPAQEYRQFTAGLGTNNSFHKQFLSQASPSTFTNRSFHIH